MKNIVASFALASALYLLPIAPQSASAQGFSPGATALGGGQVTQGQSGYYQSTLTPNENRRIALLGLGVPGVVLTGFLVLYMSAVREDAKRFKDPIFEDPKRFEQEGGKYKTANQHRPT
jgi:hypothetical protein